MLDGSDDADNRLDEMLHWDVNNGIARRAWARNQPAEIAISRAMEKQPLLQVNLPNHVADELIDEIFEGIT